MKKFKFVLFAALLMFLDIVVLPNKECGKKYYYLVFEVEIVNVEQSDNGYFTNGYSDKVIVQYYKLSEDELTGDTELSEVDFLEKMKTILKDSLKYCEKQEFNGDIFHKYYDLNVKDFDIISVTDNKNNELSFPIPINKRNFKRTGKKYCYTLKIKASIDYELGVEGPWELDE